MDFPIDARNGFARLNLALGAKSSINCQYVWDESSVALKNAYFDEAAYRFSKLTLLAQRESCLSLEQKECVLDVVLAENQQLLMDISYAAPDQWKQLDAQLMFLLDGAITLAEHEEQLQISMKNISKSRSLDNSWMSLHDVNEMLTLSSRRKSPSSEASKFVGARH